MPDNVYPIDPMAAFYAAVTAVENGSIGEVELEFRHELANEEEIITTISVRREARPNMIFSPIQNEKKIEYRRRCFYT